MQRAPLEEGLRLLESVVVRPSAAASVSFWLSVATRNRWQSFSADLKAEPVLESGAPSRPKHCHFSTARYSRIPTCLRTAALR